MIYDALETRMRVSVDALIGTPLHSGLLDRKQRKTVCYHRTCCLIVCGIKDCPDCVKARQT